MGNQRTSAAAKPVEPTEPVSQVDMVYDQLVESAHDHRAASTFLARTRGKKEKVVDMWNAEKRRAGSRPIGMGAFVDNIIRGLNHV